MNLIFLTCSERSGGNLLLSMLDRHPEVRAAPTAHLFRTLYMREGMYASRGDARLAIANDVALLISASLGAWPCNAESVRKWALGAPEGTVGSVLRTIFGELARQYAVEHLVVKLHQAHLYSDRLRRDFPRAEYIHLVRDPRGMAASWKKSAVFRGRVMRACSIWCDDQVGFLARGLLPVDAAVQYEMLLASPEAHLSSICEPLGLAFDCSMLDFCNSCYARDNSSRNPAWSNIATALDERRAYDWKYCLDDDELYYISTQCGNIAAEFGYRVCFVSGQSTDAVASRLAAREYGDKMQFLELPDSDRLALTRLTRVLRELESGYLDRP